MPRYQHNTTRYKNKICQIVAYLHSSVPKTAQVRERMLTFSFIPLSETTADQPPKSDLGTERVPSQLSWHTGLWEGGHEKFCRPINPPHFKWWNSRGMWDGSSLQPWYSPTWIDRPVPCKLSQMTRMNLQWPPATRMFVMSTQPLASKEEMGITSIFHVLCPFRPNQHSFHHTAFAQ